MTAKEMKDNFLKLVGFDNQVVYMIRSNDFAEYSEQLRKEQQDADILAIKKYLESEGVHYQLYF